MARTSLTGEHKDAENARKLLLEIVDSGSLGATSETLSYAYVYLGYIEDRAGHRQRAIAWFEKALAVEGGSPGILDVARVGLERPVTWIRHLDAARTSSGTPSRPAEAPRPAKAYVTAQPPTGMTLAKNLSAQQRRENFDALWNAIDTAYACFKLKSIDWQEVGRRYRQQLDTTSSDDDFYALIFRLVNELKDTHSWLQGYKDLVLQDATDLSIDLFEERPFVVAVKPGSEAAVAGVTPGWEVLSVDGLTVAEKMEALRPHLHACSSERAYHRGAGRRLLAGESGSMAAVTLRSPDGGTKTLALRRISGPGIRPPARAAAFALTRQHFVHFGRHPSGLGYIQIESFNGREEIADEFDRALEALRDAPGLILDIRDNTGGFGQPRIVGRLLKKRMLASVSYIKNGPGHSDLDRRKGYLDPTGGWQYTRPVALLVNDVTGSASDLFACELRSARRVIAVGTTTHGNLSGVGTFAVLPCGLVVRISNGYISDARDRPIEGNGNIPDVTVAPTIQDFLNGRDPVLERAVGILMK
ncbi:MAG: S41 family peptidase [Bryobacteraceae bacterium]